MSPRVSVIGEPPPMPATTAPSARSEMPKSSLVPLVFASTRPAPAFHLTTGSLVTPPLFDLNHSSMEKSFEIWRLAVPYEVVPLNDTALFESPADRPATPSVVPDSVALAGLVGSESTAV